MITFSGSVILDVIPLNQMQAIISDIHGNLEALGAVLSQIGDTDILCLGDVVCYGPDSIECVRQSANWNTVVSGPMDIAMVDHKLDQWNPTLNQYIEKTRQRFRDAPDADSLFRILGSYRSEFTNDGRWFFHGAPRNIREWIFPEEIYCPSRLDKLVDSAEHAFIGGGSHIPGVFRRSGAGWEFDTPENGKSYDLPPDEKTIITIGSVGQPRDNDSRAAYAILNNTTITFHRIEYDLDLTRTKIESDPDIDDMHGGRLPHGR